MLTDANAIMIHWKMESAAGYPCVFCEVCEWAVCGLQVVQQLVRRIPDGHQVKREVDFILNQISDTMTPMHYHIREVIFVTYNKVISTCAYIPVLIVDAAADVTHLSGRGARLWCRLLMMLILSWESTVYNSSVITSNILISHHTVSSFKTTAFLDN